MGNLLMILGILLLALLIVVPLMERFGKRHSSEELRKINRFIFPLVGLLILLQAILYFFKK